METKRIPTSREGIYLSPVTDLEHSAWIETNRTLVGCPTKPHHIDDPNYYSFQEYKREWSRVDPEQLSMGIWDERRPRTPLFAGYVTLKPYNLFDQRAAEVGYEIAKKYHRSGYAGLAVNAIMKYGRDQLGYQTIVADILSKNLASCALVEKLGFELSPTLSRQKAGHSIYLHVPPVIEAAA